MRSSRIKTLALGAAILALSSAAGVAYAASERYDSAKANIDKAIALLKAIDDPKQSPAEKGRREHAIRELEGALQQIDKAKTAADKAAAAQKEKDKKDHKGSGDHKDHKGHDDHKDHKNKHG